MFIIMNNIKQNGIIKSSSRFEVNRVILRGVLPGAGPKVIRAALGQASVAFTTDCYSHIISGMQGEAMSLLDGVMPAAGVFKNPSPNPSPK